MTNEFASPSLDFQHDSLSQPQAASQPLNPDLVRDFNWSSASILGYIAFSIALSAVASAGAGTFLLMAAWTTSGYCSVVFSIMAGLRGNKLFAIAVLLFVAVAAVDWVWIPVLFVNYQVAKDLRASGFQFGLLGNAKPISANSTVASA